MALSWTHHTRLKATVSLCTNAATPVCDLGDISNVTGSFAFESATAAGTYTLRAEVTTGPDKGREGFSSAFTVDSLGLVGSPLTITIPPPPTTDAGP